MTRCVEWRNNIQGVLFKIVHFLAFERRDHVTNFHNYLFMQKKTELENTENFSLEN